MAELDIRDDAVSEIDTIRFSSYNVLSKRACSVFCVGTEDNTDVAYLEIKDIPNLIKALQKAQELWDVDNK